MGLGQYAVQLLTQPYFDTNESPKVVCFYFVQQRINFVLYYCIFFVFNKLGYYNIYKCKKKMFCVVE